MLRLHDSRGPSGRASALTRRALLGTLVAALPGLSACASRSRRAVPDFVDVIAQVSPAVIAIGRPMETVGSGFAIAPGTIATAAHVLQAAQPAPQIRFKSQTYAATVLREDAPRDLALLRVDGAGVPVLPLAPPERLPRVGEWIVVLGNPFGTGIIATVGVVSAAVGAITSSPQMAEQFQINASVNPGNSGGPVCNLRGEVIGVATSFIPGGQGLAFVMPVSALRSLLSRT